MLVSIIVPVHNAEPWLAETLNSALAQTWPSKEIIVVDDGSSDNSFAVAKSFDSPIVKLIRQENRGASAARNRGLQEAQGDFIQYLDADDLLSPDKIHAQLDLLAKNQTGTLALSGTIYFFDGNDPSSGMLQTGWPLVDGEDPIAWLTDLMGAGGNGGMVHPGAWLVPKAVADAAGPWDEQLSVDDDGEYFARVVLASTGICRSMCGLSYYRKHLNKSNLSARTSEEASWSGLRSTDLKSQHLLTLTNDVKARRAFARAYMAHAIASFPDYPAITESALSRVRELGGVDTLPVFGGWRTMALAHVFGWKLARRIVSLAKYPRTPKAPVRT